MKCVFCGQDSSKSKSVEHLVPESFGNKTAVLPKGIVCDKCNNYFARKVEQPFLESETVRMLRQELALENKRGRIIADYQYPRMDQEQIKQLSEDTYLIYTKDDKTKQQLAHFVAEYQEYVNLTDEVLLKKDFYVSRLLAKMAVEYFIYCCGSSQEVCEYILSDGVFDDIKSYARYGNRKMWDYNARRIYGRNEAYKGDPFSAISWEADFLFLGNGEIYFIIAMHGIEYAINMGGSILEGYIYWLKQHNNQSPLNIPEEDRRKNYEAYIMKISTVKEKVLWYDYNEQMK